MIDSHCHLNFRSKSELSALGKAGYKGAVTCAYFPFSPSGPATLIDHFELLLRRYCDDFSGLQVRCALGIHPRSIPKWGTEEVLGKLPEFLRQEKCVALGEVGLETGSGEEVAILAEQLDIATKEKKPVVMHTPRKNKLEVFKKEIDAISSSDITPEMIIADHMDSSTIELAIKNGFNVGVSVNEGKLSSKEVLDLLKENYSLIQESDTRVLLNTDLAFSCQNLFVLRDAISELKEAVDTDFIEAISYKNASDIFNF